MRLFLLTALTMTAFAGNSVLNRMAVGAGEIGAAEFAAIRLVSGAVALLALLALRWLRRGLPVWPGTAGRAAGAATLLVYLAGFSVAYGGLDAGTGALILFGMVQVTMFAGALWQRERVPGRRWLGAGLALVGLAALLSPGAAVSLPHAACMALAGVGWGLYSLSAHGQGDALAATAWNFALAVPAGLALVWLLPGAPVAFGAKGVALAVLSGVVTSGLGYALWYAILPDLGAARAGVAQLTVPVIAAAGGAALLAEPVTLHFALAALVVLGGVALAIGGRR